MCPLFVLFLAATVFSSATNANHTRVERNDDNPEEIMNMANYEEQEDICSIRKNWTMPQRCIYVTVNNEACEGGGYTYWTLYTQCTESVPARVFVYIGAIAYMLALFLHVSVTADDFFSTNIAAIVAHLKISETIAGVTFLAFGNGAPDIFGSIASMLSTTNPKASLALGSLLGGGLFVVTVVLATIIFKARSFRVNISSSIREYLFYTIAVSWILYIFLRGNTVVLYEPLVDLGIYFLYVVAVIALRIFMSRLKAKRLRQRSLRKSIEEEGLPKDLTPDRVEVEEGEEEEKEADEPSGNSTETNVEDTGDIIILHHRVLSRRQRTLEAGESVKAAEKVAEKKKRTWLWKDLLIQPLKHVNPWPEAEEWKEAGRIEKFFTILKMPSMFLLKASVPRYEDPWIKPMAMIYLLLTPQLILGALQYWTTIPFHRSPPLFVYGIGLSLIFIVLVLLFTRMDTPPRFYKEVYTYLGFVMAIAWIYLASSEIVGVITMIGVVTGLSFEFLGLTILAWSNCIGDFASDLSVVKQGFPRMAWAAATGGPLFNLLVGFGVPFVIATAKGQRVSIEFTTQLRFLIIFIYVSIIVSMIGLIVQRFHVTRWHSLALVIVYGVFLVLVILCEADVIRWQ